MSRLFFRKLNAYILSIAVFFTLGMSFDTSNNDPFLIISNSIAVVKPEPFVPTAHSILPWQDTTLAAAFSTRQPQSQPQTEAIGLSIATDLLAMAAAPKYELAELPASHEAAEEPTEEPMRYEVTAYLLNVRINANADGESRIIDVLKRGSILEVSEVIDNGWLKLKKEGYVHGKYTKLVSYPVKESSRVKILSAEITTVAAGKTEDATKVESEDGSLGANADHRSTEDGSLGANVDRIAAEEATAAAVTASQQANSIKPAGIPSKPTSLVKSESSLTEEHITQLFAGTALSGHELEKAIVEIEQEYGINAYFTIAVMKLESGHGKSQIAQIKNNMFGLNAIDNDAYNKAFSFNTKGESVQKFGQLISENYIDQGYTSVEKVARKYCQANPDWPMLVKRIMESDYNKLL
jgi:beta-N-acetylglucosaminidase